jgi:hypothetical protein
MSIFRFRKIAIVLLLLLHGYEQQAGAAEPVSEDRLAAAVVRIISHGCSGTVIRTEPGRSFILSCGHAFAGGDRTRPITLDVPTTRPGTRQKVGIQLLAVDYGADLALLLLRAGPVEFAAPVGPDGHRAGRHRLLSVGYDAMRLPAVQLPCHLLSEGLRVQYTVEKPGHGRSGGALLDATDGYLIGVVSGYEVDGPGRGIYVSHAAILNFLRRCEGKAIPEDRNQGSGVRSQGSESRPPLSYLRPPTFGLPLTPPCYGST